jgi:hypothetical protein
MFNGELFTEVQFTETFGKAVSVRLRCLTGGGQSIFDEFKAHGKSYIGGYDNVRKLYYILNADAHKPAEQFPQSKGQIITIRTKPEKKPQPQRLEVMRIR